MAEKSAYIVTDKAGRFVAGGKNPGEGETIYLTAKQAAHELRLGTIAPAVQVRAVAPGEMLEAAPLPADALAVVAPARNAIINGAMEVVQAPAEQVGLAPVADVPVLKIDLKGGKA